MIFLDNATKFVAFTTFGGLHPMLREILVSGRYLVTMSLILGIYLHLNDAVLWVYGAVILLSGFLVLLAAPRGVPQKD